MICDSLNGVRITKTICMYSRQGSKSTIVHGSWELDHRYWRVILGQGLLLAARRWYKGTGGRRIRWGMPLEVKKGSHAGRALLLSHAQEVEPSL